jgi:hypothetical protein
VAYISVDDILGYFGFGFGLSWPGAVRGQEVGQDSGTCLIFDGYITYERFSPPSDVVGDKYIACRKSEQWENVMIWIGYRRSLLYTMFAASLSSLFGANSILISLRLRTLDSAVYS